MPVTTILTPIHNFEQMRFECSCKPVTKFDCLFLMVTDSRYTGAAVLASSQNAFMERTGLQLADDLSFQRGS